MRIVKKYLSFFANIFVV